MIVLLAGSVAQASTDPTLDEATPSISGTTGLMRVSTAEPGTPRDLQIALIGEVSRSKDLLILGDVATRAALHLATAVSLNKNLQLFAAVATDETWQSVSAGSANRVFSSRFVAGTKIASSFGQMLAAGAELGIGVPADGAALPASLSVWFNLLCSVDVPSQLTSHLRAHVNLGYFDDNSWRQLKVSGMSASAQEVLMFAEGSGGSRIRGAIGLESVLYHHAPGRMLTAFAEYHYEWVVAPLGGAFFDQPPANQDQQWLTAGVRASTLRKITIGMAVDAGIRSAGFSYGPPLPPFSLLLEASVPFGL